MTSDKSILPFNKFGSNIHSQNGEDGVIAEILRRIGGLSSQENWCVEFGAWDGIFLSNTFALVERGWRAVYIEGDEKHYQDLLSTAEKHQKIIPVNAFVARTQDAENSLNSILSKTPIPLDFAVLSIDIDSYDCDVWESLQDYKPRIVVIEINSAVPPGIIWRHSAKTEGNTFTATLNVGIKKGYTLVCHTGNLIFVRNDLTHHLDIEQRFIDFPELLFLYDNPWLPEGLFSKKEPRSQSVLRVAARHLPEWIKSFLRRFRFAVMRTH